MSLKRRFEHVTEGTNEAGSGTLLNKIYTELYITEGQSEEVDTQHEVRQLERTSKKNIQDTPIKCQDIFKVLSEQQRHIRVVLTNGVAGVGKTFSVQKFSLDWAEGLENQDISLVLPLSWRELNLIRDERHSLLSLLHVFHPTLQKIRAEDLTVWKLLFIFDGLDESRFSLGFNKHQLISDVTQVSSVDVLLVNLIQGNLLPSALIWITSRPAAAHQIPPSCVDRITEVRGFTDSQKEEYFRRRFSDEDLSKRIISHIKASRSLHIMCLIPVFCWITAIVLEDMMTRDQRGELPQTLTDLYSHFLRVQIKRKKQKYGGKQRPEELTEADKELLLKLGRLAFEHLEKGNIMFYSPESQGERGEEGKREGRGEEKEKEKEREEERRGEERRGEETMTQMDEDRAESTVPSCVSLKSDRSKDGGIIDFRSSEEIERGEHILSNWDQSAPPGESSCSQSGSRSGDAEMKPKQRTNEAGSGTLLNKIYTELYITEGQSEEVDTQHEVRQLERTSKKNIQDTPIKCQDIFKVLSEQQRHIRVVLTNGVAGVGKTFSVQKFSLDWAEGLENQDISLVLPLSCRELNLIRDEQHSLLSLLHVFHPTLQKIRAEDLTVWKLLFIFDGLDESSFIWITSRPAAAHQIPPSCVDRITEVRGFTDSQKEEYFRRRFSDEDLSKRIISHIKASRSLHIMCLIPVFCWITAIVLEDMMTRDQRGELPQTLTDLYSHF
ncbi:NLR family CARD domain-containing protein 3 CARD15-like protein [Takifugu flavidus]|uniref:NLR family CARD domain-containing protein 3 CARD15-like protein n=1 Tax=Takifugu flavidus TaxID=433684 RepID=A0A5C6P4N8_9TELE|nr:NLR family CARD domain-containing protein 3 CARD15-like protein [Takifugu flavidus]